MVLDWSKIRDRISTMCRSAFDEDASLSISSHEIEEAIIVFYNVCTTKLNYFNLDGLTTEIQGQLQDILIDKIDSVSALKSFASSLDTFLKRIFVVSNLSNYNDIKDGTLLKLVKRLNEEITNRGGTFLGNQLPSFDNCTDLQLKENGNGQYIFNCARKARNLTTHNCPAYDIAGIMLETRYVVAFYIYVIHRIKGYILDIHPEFNIMPGEANVGNTLSIDELRAYNFIAYGSHSQEVKLRYLDCFILYHLYENGAQSIVGLKNATQQFLGRVKTQISVNNAIKRLTAQEYLSSTPQIIKLTEKGVKRISDNRDNLIANKQSFQDELQSILSSFNLSPHFQEIESHLTSFIEENAVDIASAETDNIANDRRDVFLTQLKSFGLSDDSSKELFLKMISLCKRNDIILKLSLGKAIGTLTDLDQFSQKVRNLKRDIFLDSNVALFLLCLSEDFPTGKDYAFKIAQAIINNVRESPNLSLKISTVYFKELEFNLRRALLLTDWESIGWKGNVLPTNNLFYRHYLSLRDSNQLPIGVESFTEYLKANFTFEDGDIDLPEGELTNVIKEIVTYRCKEIGIEIVSNHHIEPSNISRSTSLFQTVLREGKTSKDDKQLNNDVLMGEHLFADDSYNIIFLSNDKSFNPYRKRFIQQYRRQTPDVWMLFTASRFVGHLDLLNSRFESQMLTDELLALIESEDIKNKSVQLADVAARLVDLSGLTALQKRQRLNALKNIIEQEESKDIPDISEEIEERTKRLNEIWDTIRNSISAKMNIRNFYEMLKDEDFFESTVSIIQKGVIDSKLPYSQISTEVENLIKIKKIDSESKE